MGVELVFALGSGSRIIDVKELKLSKKVDTLAFYDIEFELKKPGSYDYGLRIFPKHKKHTHTHKHTTRQRKTEGEEKYRVRTQ